VARVHVRETIVTANVVVVVVVDEIYMSSGENNGLRVRVEAFCRAMPTRTIVRQRCRTAPALPRADAMESSDIRAGYTQGR
jgi:hypothetical protein